MKTREEILLDGPTSQGAGLVRLDAAGYRAYSWERGITVPTAPMDHWDEPAIPRELAYALNVVVFGA